MKSTNQIIIELKENKRPTYNELKLALLAESSILHFYESEYRHLKNSIKEGKFEKAKLQCQLQDDFEQRMLNAGNTDPEKYLGKTGIPGNPEHDKFYNMVKNLTNQIINERNE